MNRMMWEISDSLTADGVNKVLHFMELIPKRVNRSTPIRLNPSDMGKRLGAIIENETVYQIHTETYQEQTFSLITTGKTIGWVNSMWLEDL